MIKQNDCVFENPTYKILLFIVYSIVLLWFNLLVFIVLISDLIVTLVTVLTFLIEKKIQIM